MTNIRMESGGDCKQIDLLKKFEQEGGLRPVWQGNPQYHGMHEWTVEDLGKQILNNGIFGLQPKFGQDSKLDSTEKETADAEQNPFQDWYLDEIRQIINEKSKK